MPTVLYDEYRKIHATLGAVTIERGFRVEPWADWPQVAELLLGSVRLVGGHLTRVFPARDPQLPWCFCQEVSVEGVGVYGTAPQGTPAEVLNRHNGYEQGARLVALYKTPDEQRGGYEPQDADAAQSPTAEEQEEIEIASEQLDFSIQNLTLPGQHLKWEGSPDLLQNQNTQAIKGIPRVSYALVRHYVLRLPVAAIVSLSGRINKNAIRVNGNIWPKETWRFDGASSTRKVTLQGFKHYQVTYKFEIQPTYDNITSAVKDYVGWNRLFRPASGIWEKVVWAGAPGRFIHEFDEDAPSQTIRGRTVKGFALLFHPGAR